MGDWSNNLEYEQREHYGHFYDTDEDVHEEETEEETDDAIQQLKDLGYGLGEKPKENEDNTR